MYKIVVAMTRTELVKQVNNAMLEGWIPQGGIAVHSSPTTLTGDPINHSWTWAQAMVRYAD
jgi:hypothetical protein